jgi:hypothetical protein
MRREGNPASTMMESRLVLDRPRERESFLIVTKVVRLSWGTDTLTGDGFRAPWEMSDPFSVAGTFVFNVAGPLYHRRELQEACFAPGCPVLLIPEPDNPHDHNAIAVWDADQRFHVGYVPQTVGPHVAALLTPGPAFALVIWQWIDTDGRHALRVIASRAPLEIVESPEWGSKMLVLHEP